MNHPNSIPVRVKSSAPRQRPGFTLVELTVSLVITSTLMVAIGASIVVASHAIPNGKETTAATLNVSKAIDRMVEELQYARVIVEKSSSVIEFTVPDRSGNSIDETIRYEWLGMPGDPLTRQYNGGPLLTIIERVKSLDLGYITGTYSKQMPSQISSETLLSSHVAAGGTVTNDINSTWSMGQYFTIDVVPVEATDWAVTRILVYAEIQGPDKGVTSVELRLPDDGNMPVSAQLDQQEMRESNLTASAQWYECQFTNVNGLPTNTGLCIVLMWVSDANSATIHFDENAGSGLLSTSDGGLNWNLDAQKSLNYYAYGTFTTPGAIVDAYALYRVDIELISGDTTDFTIHASAKMLNLPEVSTP
ncbi:MAG: prepilin-type N-terminal cleavage/methylation domain-containing protein [Planctomycetota bacterium]|nr:prepilin-type N-terminal cleavage/methylation domain-containing protein [Planctomycetota bacterium]